MRRLDDAARSLSERLSGARLARELHRGGRRCRRDAALSRRLLPRSRSRCPMGGDHCRYRLLRGDEAHPRTDCTETGATAARWGRRNGRSMTQVFARTWLRCWRQWVPGTWWSSTIPKRSAWQGLFRPPALMSCGCATWGWTNRITSLDRHGRSSRRTWDRSVRSSSAHGLRLEHDRPRPRARHPPASIPSARRTRNSTRRRFRPSCPPAGSRPRTRAEPTDVRIRHRAEMIEESPVPPGGATRRPGVPLRIA